MDSQKRNSRAVIMSVVVLVLVIIGGGVAWWMMAKPAEVPTETPESYVSTEFTAEQIILATRNVDAPESGSDTGDREFEYKLMGVDTKTLGETSLGSFKNNIFVNPFSLVSGGPHFINPEGEFAWYNFYLRQTFVTKIPGVEPVFGFFNEHSMWDFKFSGTTLVYLRGTCAEGTRCDLYLYDFPSKTNTLILANLQKLMKMDETSGLSLHTYDPIKNMVTVKKGGSDGAYSYTELFEVSLAEKKIMASQKIVNVGDKEGDPLTEKEKQDNAKSDELARVRLTCGSAQAVQEFATFKLESGDYATEQQTTVTSGALKKSYHPTFIVGCSPL